MVSAMKKETTFTARGLKTRNKILKTATRLIADKGYHAVSVDEIVDKAGVNKRMVYHYFGNKEGLYREILLEEYSKLGALEIAELAPQDPIEKVVPSIVHTYFTFLKKNKVFVRLLLWENLNHGRALKTFNESLSKAPVLDLLEESIIHAREEGRVRREINPKLLLVSLIGNCMIYYSNQHTLSAALEIELTNEQTLQEAETFIAETILHGILAD